MHLSQLTRNFKTNHKLAKYFPPIQNPFFNDRTVSRDEKILFIVKVFLEAALGFYN